MTISCSQQSDIQPDSRKTIDDVEDILCHTKPGDNAANWKIELPEDLILPTIKWYHHVTGHPGSKIVLSEKLRVTYWLLTEEERCK